MICKLTSSVSEAKRNSRHLSFLERLKTQRTVKLRLYSTKWCLLELYGQQLKIGLFCKFLIRISFLVWKTLVEMMLLDLLSFRSSIWSRLIQPKRNVQTLLGVMYMEPQSTVIRNRQKLWTQTLISVQSGKAVFSFTSKLQIMITLKLMSNLWIMNMSNWQNHSEFTSRLNMNWLPKSWLVFAYQLKVPNTKWDFKSRITRTQQKRLLNILKITTVGARDWVLKKKTTKYLTGPWKVSSLIGLKIRRWSR